MTLRALRSLTPRSNVVHPLNESLDDLRCSSAPLPQSKADASPLITPGRLRSEAVRFRRMQQQQQQQQLQHASTPVLPSGADCSIEILPTLSSPKPIRSAKSAPHSSTTAVAAASTAAAALTADVPPADCCSSPGAFASALEYELLHHCRTCRELVPLDSKGRALCATPNRRAFSSLMMLSHVPFALAIYLALSSGHARKGFVYAASLIASLLYHRSREHHFCQLDVFLACSLILTNCVRLYERWMWIPAGLAVWAFGVYQRAFGGGIMGPLYESSHPLWHLLSGMGTLCLYVPDML